MIIIKIQVIKEKRKKNVAKLIIKNSVMSMSLSLLTNYIKIKILFMKLN